MPIDMQGLCPLLAVYDMPTSLSFYRDVLGFEIHGLCPLLAVYDMPTSLRFYRDLLGFEIHMSSDPEPDGHIDWVWLRRSDADLM